MKKLERGEQVTAGANGSRAQEAGVHERLDAWPDVGGARCADTHAGLSTAPTLTGTPGDTEPPDQRDLPRNQRGDMPQTGSHPQTEVK